MRDAISNSNEKKIKLPKLITMTNVVEKEPEWLIPYYIPKQCISIMAGDGGVGKTTVWCGIVAGISAGEQVFFDPVPRANKPQKVLFFCSEDSAEHTLRAKLRKAGANLGNILFASLKDETFAEIKFNSKILEELIKEEKPALVVFDPIQSFLPTGVQMGQRNAMRNCLNPLIGWGEEYGCTSLVVTHTNKKQGVFGRDRISDSSDIWDIARSVLIVGQTQDGRRYLSHEKSNYGELQATAIFDIKDGVAILDGYTDKKDRDFAREKCIDKGRAPQRANAEKFILDFLRDKEKPTAELDAAAKAFGISPATLRRAKEQLKKKEMLELKSKGNGANKVFYSRLKEVSG